MAMNDGNAPMMSSCDAARAPWNDKDNGKLAFDVEVSCTLTRNIRLKTDDYEEHGFCGDVTYDTSETDWEKAYEDCGYLSIKELLENLKAYVEEDLQKCSSNSLESAYLKRILASCEGWHTEETKFLCL